MTLTYSRRLLLIQLTTLWHMRNSMKVLLSNDDGIDATGLKILHNLLSQMRHEVFVVAPEHQHSGTSHTITLQTPLIPKKVYKEGIFYGYSINGSPADSVKLGISDLCPKDIDIVLSGINLGNNAGPAIYYSGTVAAAFEGAAVGKPSLAFSFDSFDEKKFKGLEERIKPFFPTLLEICTEKILYNINIPKTPAIKGILVTRQFLGFFMDQYEKKIDPRNREYFWLKNVSYSGEIVPSEAKTYQSDLEILKDGYITITPLQFDLTDYSSLNGLQKKLDQSLSKSKT